MNTINKMRSQRVIKMKLMDHNNCKSINDEEYDRWKNEGTKLPTPVHFQYFIIFLIFQSNNFQRMQYWFWDNFNLVNLGLE